ncbi:unnamed protein product [Musa acuminata subsp. burmannicoides]
MDTKRSGRPIDGSHPGPSLLAPFASPPSVRRAQPSPTFGGSNDNNYGNLNPDISHRDRRHHQHLLRPRLLPFTSATAPAKTTLEGPSGAVLPRPGRCGLNSGV